MELKIGNTYFVKCTIGLNHLTAYKVTVLKIRKEKGIIISYRCKVLESYSMQGDFVKEKNTILRTFRAELIGISKGYQFYDTREEFLQRINDYYDNQIKLIAILRGEILQFSN